MCEIPKLSAPVHAEERSTPARIPEPLSDRERLRDTWEAQGWDSDPPNCMSEYADAVIEALR